MVDQPLAFCAGAEDAWGPASSNRHQDMTLCFQETVIGPVVNGLFLLFAINRLPRLLRKPRHSGSINVWVARGKQFVAFPALVVLSLVALITSGTHAGAFTSTVLNWLLVTISTIVAFVLITLEQSRSRTPSSLVCLYGFFHAIAVAWRLRALTTIDDVAPASSGLTIAYLVVLIVAIALEAASTFSSDPTATVHDPMASPEHLANIFSKITFTWTYGILKIGVRKFLDLDDLWTVPEDHTAHASHVMLAAEIEKRKGKRHALFGALMACFGSRVFKVFFGLIVVQVFNFFVPLLVEQLIGYVGQWNAGKVGVTKADGILIAVGWLAIAIVSAFLYNLSFFICFRAEIALRAALMATIYRKSMRIPAHARDSTGAIVNHMQVDAAAIGMMVFHVPNTAIVPVQVVAYLILLYVKVGIAALIAFGLVLGAAFIMSALAKYTLVYQKSKLNAMDERIRLTSEVLKGIKTIKLFGWSQFFQDRIVGVRARELHSLKQVNAMSSYQASFSTLVPSLLAFATFALFTAISSKPLTPQLVFVALSVLNLLGAPIMAIVWSFGPIMQGVAGYQRVRRFLDHHELDLDAVTVRPHTEGVDVALEIKDGFFYWDGEGDDKADPPSDLDQCVLKNINLTVRKGTSVAIVAPVGQGKTTLVSAMLGEVYRARGSVSRFGSVAMVAQVPWIVNATVRDNITFGHVFNQAWYDQVVDACSLRRDFTVLDYGDKTMIGEKGINLSGGQRARIACARALYSKADIFIFDDPLSAVDAHVDRHMFNNILGPNGLLKDKTRILVTHAVHHLAELDHLVLLDHGRIVESGTYTELAANTDPDSMFNQLVAAFNAKRHHGNGEEGLSDEDDASSSGLDGDVVHNRRDSASAVSISAAAHAKDLEAKEELDDGTLAPLLAASTKNVKKKAASVHPKDDEDENEEGMERGSVGREVYMTYIDFCGRWAFVINALLSALSIGLTLGTQYVLGAWSADPSASTWKWLSIYAGMTVANSILTGFAFYYFFAVIAIKCSERTSTTLLARLLRLPQAMFDVTPVGRILNRVSKDQDSVDTMLPPQVHHYFFALLQLLSILISIAVATPWFLVLVLPLSGLFYVIQRTFLSASRELQRLTSVTRSPVYQLFSESLEGLLSIRAFAVQDRFCDDIDAKIDLSNKALYTQVALNRWLGLVLQMISAIIMFGAALFAALAPERGTTLIGVSVTFAQQLTWMLIQLVRIYCDIETNIVSVERIREYAEMPPEAAEHTDLALPADWPTTGKIEFDHYSTRYRPGLDLVLRNLSLSIQGGEKIGIVGRTGAGKSSATLALFRIIEAAEGAIKIDGVDISQLGLQDLRTRLTVLPQEPVIFEGTVRENLDPLGTKSDADMWAALAAAHLKPAIEELGDGLDSPIKAGSLSVGQSQLLCLARAILRKTRVLALDEASASVDHRTDEYVQETIRTAFKECTVLTIAHRVATVMDYDRILVLDHGQVSEFDSPERLLANPSSMFYGLAKESGLVA
ncbi:hypothetical protein GGF31_007656 [Allomyces arbusculus]|nr:hypothetical protein GGF31_007656 [Allomyces arbusculus]